MASKKQGKGPNYALIAGLGVAGAAACGSLAHFAFKLAPMEAGMGAVLGFVVAAGIGLAPSSGGDTKRLATEIAVKKNVDQAYQAQSLGRLDQAEKLLLEALEKGKSLGESDLSNLAATHSLGNLYRLQGKKDKAETNYRQALKTYEALGKTGEMSYALCLRDCAYVLESQGQHPASLEMARKALSIAENLKQPREVTEITNLVARNTRATGAFADAVATYLRVKDMQIQEYGDNTPPVIETVLTLARCYRSLGQHAEALDQYKDALVRTNKAERPNRLSEAEALLEMAEVRLEQGASKDVEPICLGSLKVLQSFVGPNEKMLGRIAGAIKEARAKLGQPFQETEFIWLFTQNRDQVRDTFRENAELVQQKDRTGWGPLQWTLFLGWEDLMRWLLRNGAQADGFESSVISPVHLAAAWSKGSTITFLDENKVTLDVVGPLGWSPIHHAAYHGRQDCLEQLLARNCDPKRLDVVGRNALHWAAEQGRGEAVSLLLAKELDKNAPDSKYGRSPLHLAAAAGHGSVVRTLLMNGADETLADKQGKSPIQLAEESGYSGLVTAMKHFRSAMAD